MKNLSSDPELNATLNRLLDACVGLCESLTIGYMPILEKLLLGEENHEENTIDRNSSIPDNGMC